MGTILPTCGPGLSARIRCMVAPPVSGIMAKIKTKMPMPPIQCVKLRQNSEQRAKASTLLSTLEPVVVKPETVSKNASTKRGISLFMTNGAHPARLAIIHAAGTTTKPSLA